MTEENPEDEAMRLAGNAVKAINDFSLVICDLHDDTARIALDALLAALGRASDTFIRGRTA